MMDDGIAIAVLENIGSKLGKMGLEVIVGETDIQSCFHQLSEEDSVIILDATYSGGPVGSVYLCKIEEAMEGYGETDFQHDLSLFDLMRLYSKSLNGYFIGIEVAEVGFNCELSDSLKCIFQDICFDVEKIIQKIVEEGSYA